MVFRSWVTQQSDGNEDSTANGKWVGDNHWNTDLRFSYEVGWAEVQVEKVGIKDGWIFIDFFEFFEIK